MGFEKGIVTDCSAFRKTVFRSGEIEDIRITGKTPILKSRNIKTQVSAILVTDARSLGKCITERIIEKR